MSRTAMILSGILPLSLAVALFALAEQPTTRPAHPMMQQCAEKCQATGKSIDQLLASVDEARQSNDPAKMKAALDQTSKQLGEMKANMAACQEMMQKMHGGAAAAAAPQAAPPAACPMCPMNSHK